MEFWRTLTAHRPVTMQQNQAKLGKLTNFKRDISGGWVIFLIRCNFNNVHTSTQSFFELRNGQLFLLSK